MNTPFSEQIHVVIEEGGIVQIGTCWHCCVEERGRPERATETEGDRHLDFPRDRLLHRLAELGVLLTVLDEYVCP